MKVARFFENILLRTILFIVDSLIFIGQFTQKLILSLIGLPIFLIKKLAKIILYFLKKIKLLVIFFGQKLAEFIKIIKIKLEALYSFKLKPSIKLPRLKIVLPKFKIRWPTVNFLSLKLQYFLFGCIATLIIISFYQGYIFVKNLPSPYNIGKVNFSLTSHMYDRNGRLLYEIYRTQNRTPVKLTDLPQFVIHATIAAEDKEFYKHIGISFYGGIIRALKEMTVNKGQLQGGSTITQQLVKSSLLTPERTITRKIKEIILALWTERIYSKNQILEMYFNQVPYGGATYGIEEAAKVYFGKSAKDLNLEEAATLAGLPQAPSIYSPYSNPQAALMRRNSVLKSMYELKMISKKTYQAVVNKKLIVIPPTTAIKAPHFVFYLRQQLEEAFGIQKVEEGGLRVTSTIDLNIQNEVEKILKEEIEKIKNLNVTNGAILVTRPQIGEVLAMVGSVDYFAMPSGAFNVTTAERQPGSSIKPIMYSLALEKGFTAATILDDSPVVFNINGSEPYRPVNYDGRFHGKIPLRYALANSYNVPAVKTLALVGVDNFIDQAGKMGITTWTDPTRYGLSLTLGGGEVKMVDMAEAFGTLANLGRKTKLSSWIRVKDMMGNKLSEFTLDQQDVLDSGIAFIISDILSDNFARQWAFGSRSSLEVPGYKVAVKTGTTNDKKDNWAIGYNPEFLVAVWVGNNNNTPMNQYLTSGITGAAPIWNRIMSYLLKNYSDGKSWYDKPSDVVEKNCYFGRKEYFIAGTEDKVGCQSSIFNLTPTPTPEGYRTTQ
ncbi:penicillin-binding protein [Candidatus Roizmanbacteria bacterium CG_4_10_14_0_8_um_filter_36_36]|nr:MAG: penicillin-binding protein [Candidatus Roizmanbacteria bacterium CG_4_10_14_0_8_um_filter_36_36]PJA53370.1 MAG: penicillin-binding protein [Candidatus Roizmanbacteria bacterium CG_4_9_14_3_um_filter_36_11]